MPFAVVSLLIGTTGAVAGGIVLFIVSLLLARPWVERTDRKLEALALGKAEERDARLAALTARSR